MLVKRTTQLIFDKSNEYDKKAFEQIEDRLQKEKWSFQIPYNNNPMLICFTKNENKFIPKVKFEFNKDKKKKGKKKNVKK